MTPSARHDRTARLLAARLHELGAAVEREPRRRRELERAILGAAAATRHAVELELLSTEEACEIWAEAARQHPAAHLAERGGSLAA
jgi:hypothetical protein